MWTPRGRSRTCEEGEPPFALKTRGLVVASPAASAQHARPWKDWSEPPPPRLVKRPKHGDGST